MEVRVDEGWRFQKSIALEKPSDYTHSGLFPPMRWLQSESRIPTQRSRRWGQRPVRTARWGMGLIGLLVAGGLAQAALQFDVFLGYGGQPTGTDGVVREAGWFSVGCEIFNDGPGFDGVVEVVSESGGGEQTRRVALEVPTNTRKRFVIPVFSPSLRGVWTVRLIDARGRVRAEHVRVQPRALLWEGLLMGAVPRTFAGSPRLPDLHDQNPGNELQPRVARIPVELLPDNPIAYEGLNALYLSSEKALEIKEPQAEALLSWIYGGGHLLLGVEQSADVNAMPWLRLLVPGVLGAAESATAQGELQRWLVSAAPSSAAPAPDRRSGARPGNPRARPEKYRLPPVEGQVPAEPGGLDPFADLEADPTVDAGDFLVASVRLRDGRVDLAIDGRPWVISGERGRGRVTVLLFSPEREPFRSWKNRDWFWARLLGTPASWYENQAFYGYGGTSIDGLFGAMIDSRQVRKLPVRWLLLLLVVYLVVIGPFDQYVLKRLNRQMLTWITFPSYVVIFSLLIYYIGYRLRAGETEWNELHVVDVLPRADGVDLRGRSYASLYSPVNARYRLASDLPIDTLRGEFLGAMGGNQESARLELNQLDRGFNAEVFVPVWTSELLVHEWIKVDAPPLEVSVEESSVAGQFRVRVRNHLSIPLTDVRLVLRGQVNTLGEVPPGGEETFQVNRDAGLPLLLWVRERANDFRQRAQLRQRAFGSSEAAWLPLTMDNLLAASFLGAEENPDNNVRAVLAPEGFDLAAVAGWDVAVVLAWAEDHPAVPSMRRFNVMRSQQNTLYRVAVSSGSLPSP